MIQADNISKIFKRIVKDENKDAQSKKNKKEKQKAEDFYAVDHVSIKAVPGEILGILGPNGAGKTTLLRMLASLMEPSEGSVVIFDDNGNIISSKKDLKRKIGYLSANTKLYNRFSIRELLCIFANVYEIPNDLAKARIDEICSVLNLETFIDNKIGSLSTGQTQRANIARCLIHDPDIYIFDEPTLGLDIISSESIIEFMKREKEKGKVILYSTHYMEEAQYLCDQIAFMHFGRIADTGSVIELMEKTSTNNLREAFKLLCLNQNGK